ncbi:MAG: DUF4384 domain-containing protein [bacterium]|nr:DUF4384 domain-containing protein [bacterium]
MLKLRTKLAALTAMIVLAAILPARAPVFADDGNYDDDYNMSEPRIDRYLDVEVSTNHDDGEYFEGDNVTLKFRVNQDAFVVIYSVDSRDRVNLIFPATPGDDNFVRGGVTYRIPDGYSDYDLVVSGPEGVENIQIIASRDRFPVPDWYGASGLVSDWDDRFDFMDYVNARYFTRYDGQRFAYDRTAIYINEWEPDYFRPVYYPSYPSWTVSGNVYLDYPWGSSVWVNGTYWGCTPLYIPRIYVGWHTFTICDPYGHYWESDFHVTRYNTVIIDRNIIKPSPTFYSKYKSVRSAGYLDPVKNGYPDYNKKVATFKAKSGNGVTAGKSVTYKAAAKKNYVRGDAKLVKSAKGYETKSISKSSFKSRSSRSAGYSKSSKSNSGRSKTYDSGSSRKSGRSSSGYSSQKGFGSKSSSGSKYRKSTQTQKKSSSKQTVTKSSRKTTKTSKSTVKKATPQKSSKSSRSTVKKAAPKKSSSKAAKPSKSSSSTESGKSKTSKSKKKNP